MILAVVLSMASMAHAEGGKVVGWRGDGTGRYPDANPPTVWYQKENGESKNILWKTKLLCYSWSTPIFVGDKIFTESEPYDPICLNKNTGRLLWIRSFPPILGASKEEKTAPAFKAVEALVKDLQKVNDEFVAKGWSEDLYKRKYELQLKIDELSGKADPKYRLPSDKYVESWSGYTGPTPCSDGKHVYVVSGDGITACYDLNGNVKWLTYARFPESAWGEHGFGASPTLVGDILLAPGISACARDKTTGREIYKMPFGIGYSIIPFRLNGTDFAVTGGNYFRVRDGKMMVPRQGDMPSGMVVVNDGMAYFLDGHVSFVKMSPKGTDEMSINTLIQCEYNRVTLPFGQNPAFTYKLDGTIAGFYTASPLYHDGLLYCVANAGRLVVLDTRKTAPNETIVYTSFPPFNFSNGFGRKTYGFGLCASPAMAGGNIYMIDSSNCTIVMAPGREYRQVAKNVIEQTVPAQLPNTFGSKPYWMGPHQEQTEASLVFDGSRIYIRGEQFLYCIGEK